MDGQRRFLVTAGNTREAIDRVRDWGNLFTGNTGLAIAQALSHIGAVDLLTSNLQHLEQVRSTSSIAGYSFRSHQDLLLALEDRMRGQSYEAIFMSAAVADYKPAGTFAVLSRQPTETPGEERWLVKDVQAAKIRSTHRAIAVLGEPTEKIVDLFRTRWQFRGLLVKFKLEVGIDAGRLIDIGQKSRKSSGANYLVANTLEMVSGENAGAYLLSDAGEEWVPRGYLAERMVRVVEK